MPWLLLLAAVLRVFALTQAAAGPPGVMHRWAESDMNFFDAWARVVAAGDWLTDRSLHPSHAWHREAAQIHLADRAAQDAGQQQQQGQGDGAVDAASIERTLDVWWGGKRFHQEPLYAYLVALVYAVGGGQVLGVFVLQALCGLLTVALVQRVTWHAFGGRAALVAGLGAALCGPLLFYEIVLLRASLMACAALLLVAFVQWAADRPGARRLLMLGLVGGLAMLLKTTFAPFVGLAAAGLLWRRPKGRLLGAAAVSLGVALTLLPVVARNTAVGVDALALQSVGAMAFMACNSEHARDDLVGFYPSVEDIAEVFGETAGASRATVALTMQRQGGWGALWPRMLDRAGQLLHWYETPQNVNLLFYRQLVPALAWAPVGFGLVAPLALLGLALAWVRRQGLWLALMVACAVLPLLLFSTQARYRLVLLVVLLPFAALLLIWLWDRWRLRAWRPLLTAGVLLAGAALYIQRPLPEFASPVRLDDYLQVFEADVKPRVSAAAAGQDWEVAGQALAELLALEPTFVGALGAEQAPRSAAEAQVAELFASWHRLMVDVSLKAGDEHTAGLSLLRVEAIAAALQR